MPDHIFVAIWTLSDGHSVTTLTDGPSYRRWMEDPIPYARKRLQRWNSPNRARQRLSRAVAFQIGMYVRSNSSSGPAVAAESQTTTGTAPSNIRRVRAANE
jgi:hypothetical protein